VEHEIATLHTDLHLRQRRFAMRMVATWIAANGALRDSQSVDRAGDVIWALASPEVHRMLTVDGEWTSEQYQQWLERTLVATLLA
jgi:hypothetical protein